MSSNEDHNDVLSLTFWKTTGIRAVVKGVVFGAIAGACVLSIPLAFDRLRYGPVTTRSILLTGACVGSSWIMGTGAAIQALKAVV